MSHEVRNLHENHHLVSENDENEVHELLLNYQNPLFEPKLMGGEIQNQMLSKIYLLHMEHHRILRIRRVYFPL